MARPNWYNRQLVTNAKAQGLLLLMSIMLAALFSICQMILARLAYTADEPIGFGPHWLTQKLTIEFLFTVVILVGFWISLEISNRIFGPLVRLRLNMERAAKGEALENIKFRKGDNFEELADAYNLVLNRIRKAEGLEAVHSPGIESDKNQ
jgi:methyl-accepting chemotaxis protein